MDILIAWLQILVGASLIAIAALTVVKLWFLWLD
jgi:hypothetical protein